MINSPFWGAEWITPCMPKSFQDQELVLLTWFKGMQVLAYLWLSGKDCLPRQEMWVQSLGWEDPLEMEMVTHSSILSWEIPGTDEPGGLQSTKSERVGHD